MILWIYQHNQFTRIFEHLHADKVIAIQYWCGCFSMISIYILFLWMRWFVDSQALSIDICGYKFCVCRMVYWFPLRNYLFDWMNFAFRNIISAAQIWAQAQAHTYNSFSINQQTKFLHCSVLFNATDCLTSHA